MSTTPNLLIPLIAQSQNNKEITFNTAIDTLDESLCGNKAEALSATSFTIPTTDFITNGLLKFTGALPGNCTITLPTGVAKPFLVLNQTTGGFTLTFKVGAFTTTYTVSDSNMHILYTDGQGNVWGR